MTTYFTEVRSRVDAAKNAGKGLSAQDVAYVIGKAPAEERNALIAVVNGQGSFEGKRDALAGYLEDREISRDIDAGARADAQRLTQVRALEANNGRVIAALNGAASRGADDGTGWHALLPGGDELRAGVDSSTAAAVVPAVTSSKWVEAFIAKARFLAGIPASNIHRFEGTNLLLPYLSGSVEPGVVAEGTPIPENADTWQGLSFTSVGVKDYRTVSNEVLDAASVPLRNVLGANMAKVMAGRIDHFLFNGSGVDITGLTAATNAVSTEAAVIGPPTYDDLLLAYARIEAVDGEPSVLWLSPGAAAALRAERENSDGTGQYINNPSDDLVKRAQSLPWLVSSRVPAGAFILADGAAIHAGLGQQIKVAASEHVEFQSDSVALRCTARLAGVAVADLNNVQIVTERTA